MNCIKRLFSKKQWVKLPPDVAPPMVSLEEYNKLLDFSFPFIAEHAMFKLKKLTYTKQSWSVICDIFDEPSMMHLDIPIEIGIGEFCLKKDKTPDYWKLIILELAMRGYYLQDSFAHLTFAQLDSCGDDV